MPQALFTSTPRAKLAIADVFPSAQHVSSAEGEDQYAIGECSATCCYRTAPGDFVSRQVLGCHDAVRNSRLACSDIPDTLRRVTETQTVIGLVGPEALVAEIVVKLANRFPGVVVSSTEATPAG